jgi:hypothetical protein
MKFKTPSGRIKGNIFKNALIISIDKKCRMINKSALPIKVTVPSGFAEKYRIKQEIRQVHNKCDSPEDLHLLAEQVEKGVAAMHWVDNSDDWSVLKRVFAYEYIYEVAFNRGIRHERQRRKAKHKTLTAFDIISAEDVTELSHELGVSEDKLTYAVMEVIAKRKNGGMA